MLDLIRTSPLLTIGIIGKHLRNIAIPGIKERCPQGDTPSRDDGNAPRLEVQIITDDKADRSLDLERTILLLMKGVARGKDVGEEDLSKPFKEKLKTPLTRRIIEFAGPEYVMPANITLYDGSTDPADHLNRFSMAANSGEWPMPVWCRMFQQTVEGDRGWIRKSHTNSIKEWY
ncbi:hypothetical protein Tco_0952292 [Tanacetum coccineum]|uniref:Uncharacterized protein n=1 Tax=Tanacetum coccineum TaxID=301880 RepID=A0ABQ5DYX5_9ASTR